MSRLLFLAFLAVLIIPFAAAQDSRKTTPPSGLAPSGMAWVPGGEFDMGIEDSRFPDSGPIHRVHVDGFWMDRTEVTNEQFARFVRATGYVTVAEKEPNPDDFPDAPKEKLKPFSAVFKKPAVNAAVNDPLAWWQACYGASWKHPEGPGSNLIGRDKHPVVHVCWHDAVAYCKWAQRRLPTEAEWEFAARGGAERKKYPWGDALTPGGKWMANTWQGKFPVENKLEDGYEGTAPVGSYPPNAFGLFDMSGNVWEWCADWYHPDYFKNSPASNPKGPDKGHNPAEPGAAVRVHRGGSFLCASNYCERYILGTRHPGEISSAANHLGFRCVKDPR